MPYDIKDLYSTRHAAMIEILKSTDFPTEGDWKSPVDNARLLVVADGYNVDKYKVCETLRDKVASATRKNRTQPVDTLLTAAGVISLPTSGKKSIPASVAKRVAVLDTLRHLWLLKKSGSHKLWVLSLPNGYRDWPEAALAGKDYDGIGTLLNDATSHFSADDRKHLSEATQHGLNWVKKAMIVAGSPDKPRHQAIIKRWFADANSSPADLKAAAATLNAGLKKIADRIKSTFLLVTDMPMDRGNAATARVNAFVFGDEKIDAIYVEPAFFSNLDMFKGQKNWTRIVVHELSHRAVRTQDHRYRHHPSGLKPDAGDAKFTAAQALDNADSWAMFCMDCAGQMIEADYTRVKVVGNA
ncbi:M35 family metallo-endopeptidase [Aquabacterium sp.]|uniref:M35 family metallo-endopeptidase n=1 Tax=Aquabacterium sp. TaxID=1872578 RepID=UPI0035ADBF4C